LGIEEKVRFYGCFSSNELPETMALTDIIVLPSYTEAFGIAMIEAMAYAKPVVASRVDGIPEVVEDGVTGFLCEPGNPNELAKKVLQLVGNEQLRSQMGLAGRNKILSGKFSVREYITSTIRVYQEALQLREN
jgi:glycosyltransferase involved in cell wall biosynthesis